jgi:hypothetical protein
VPEADEVETLAMELGWRPKGEFDGDEFVSAKDYILKSRDIQDTMRTHNKDLKRKLSELDSSVAELKSHNERVYKAEVSKLKSELKTLKKEKVEAISEGDVDRVDALDEQIDGVKEAIKEPPNKSASNPEFDEWVAENEWYKKDLEMAQYADVIADQHQGAPFGRMLKLVTAKVKEMYPEKFEKTKQPPGSPVEGSTKRTVTSKFTEADLTPAQKDIMNQFVRQGIMTKKQYIADIEKTQGA